MNFDDALADYRKGAFTDHDVTRCSDLSVRAWRELIKTRTVRTITDNRGPGRVRLCDATVFKRAAAIGALNRAGFSLPVSGRIAYFLPFHTLLFSICDPCTILLPRSADLEHEPGLPLRIGPPKADWFDPDKPAKANTETDWLIEIYERRFVGFSYSAKEEPWIFGDLRNDGTSFVAWFPYRQRGQFMGSAIAELAKELLPYKFVDLVAQWEDPRKVTKELGVLDYKYERHDADHDPLCLAAEATARSPLFKTTINVTLAIKKALRRYLCIEPEVLDSEMGESDNG